MQLHRDTFFEFAVVENSRTPGFLLELEQYLYLSYTF